ncbi:MAG: Rrf2 family transcriptional regulator [Myxococcota bacterium]
MWWVRRSVTLAAVRLSLQVQYAVCGAFDLAYNGHGEPVQVRVISERQGVPTRYLEQIFVRLRRAGLVHSKRGPGGGYTLARPAGTISLREVVEAVEGPLAETIAMNDEAPLAARGRRPDFVWSDLAGRLAEALEQTTLEDLCREALRRQLPREEGEAPMYFI